MYVGHLGVALGARRAHPTASLLLLCVAAQLPDWVDLLLLAAHRGGRVELGDWSHSLPAMLAQLGALGLVTLAATKDLRLMLVSLAVLASHPLLDYLTGFKALWPDGPVVGLGWYGHPLWDLGLELLLAGAGWAAYCRALPAAARRGRRTALLATAVLAVLVGAQGVVDGFLMRRYDRCTSVFFVDCRPARPAR